MKDINAHPLTDSCLCSRIMACSAERERESERKRAREERETIHLFPFRLLTGYQTALTILMTGYKMCGLAG